MITIWEPRWHDRKVLIAAHKVQEQNEIVFTRTKSIPATTKFRISGKEIRQYPISTNGAIDCYEVPLDIILKNPYTEEDKWKDFSKNHL